MADNTKTARLIMQLVDRVSGPAKAITGTLGTLDKATRGIVGMGGIPGALAGGARGLRSNAFSTAGIGAPLAFGATAAAKSVYEFEKAGNAMQAFGFLNDEQREKLEQYAQVLNKQFPVSNTKIIEAAQELFRAGFTYEQATGSLQGALQLAQAGQLDVKEAADIVTNVLTAMRLPMDTFEQAGASLRRVSDAMAYAATNSNTDIQKLGETFKFVGPGAAAVGMSLEEVAATAMVMARNGIRASEAGVAMRSALVKMAAPTRKGAAALARLNIDMRDFVDNTRQITGEDIARSLTADGLDISHLTEEIDRLLRDPKLQNSLSALSQKITETIAPDNSVLDTAQLAESVRDALLSGSANYDFPGFIKALQDAGATFEDIKTIFDQRQSVRLITLLTKDLGKVVAELEKMAPGSSAKMSEIMMKGIVGKWAAFTASIQNFFLSISDSGILATVTEVVDKITGMVDRLAKLNPQILRIGTYSALAVAGIAPLGLALSGVAGALSVLTSPLWLAVGGIAALAWFKWNGIKAGLEGVGEGFKSAISPEVAEKLQGLITKFEKLFNWAQTSPDVEAWRMWGEKIGGIFADIANVIERVVSAMQAVQNGAKWWGENMSLYGNFKKAGNALRGAVDNLGSSENKPVGGKRYRAAGGPMRAGFTYQINEKGTEMITPGRNSYVTPNHRLGGGVTMHITQHITGSNADEIAKKLGVQLRNLLMDARQTSMEGGPVYGQTP